MKMLLWLGCVGFGTYALIMTVVSSVAPLFAGTM